MPRPDNMDQYRYGAYDYRTAAEDRRLAEEEARRQRAQQDAHDAVMRQQADQARAEAERRQREKERLLQEERKDKAQQAARNQKAAKGKPAVKSTSNGNGAVSWSTGWAVIGAIGGFICAASVLQAEPQAAAVMAGISGLALGFLWRIAIALAVLGLIIAIVANIGG